MNADILLDFKSKLLGYYDNQTQAFSCPAQWAQICVMFEEIDNGKILAKNWYKVGGPDKTYLSSTLDLKESDGNVIVTPHNNITNTKSCEVVFKYEDGYWIGQNDKCIIPNKNEYFSTFVKFDGINYYSRDAGYNLDTNEFLWGKNPSEGEFHFIKK